MKISCPHCQHIHPTHQLSCRRCGEYLSAQGDLPAEQTGNPLLAGIMVGVVLLGLGFTGYQYMQSHKAPPPSTTTASKVIKTAEAPSAVTKKTEPIKKSKKRRRQR